MYRHPKLVHAPDLLYLISTVVQDAEIPCEGSGIAADIDDSIGSHLEHGVKADCIAAFSRRVDHDDIGVKHVGLTVLIGCCFS